MTDMTDMTDITDITDISHILLSQNKVCKLFIKFLTWSKCSKAEILLQKYPQYIRLLPWQKAFEEASAQYSYNACNWIFTKSNELHFALDIHFHNNQIMIYPCKTRSINTIKMIMSWDKEYNWNISYYTD
jgi:hypothetical protein